ncbi:MAG: cysteine desulfurase family protein [Bacteroidota bacterium]
MNKRQIYLDHAATTPLDARVLEAMVPYLKEQYGNASSVHALGRKARFAVEESREHIAAILGVMPGEIVFTSGGTESNNTAVKGALKQAERLLVTSVVEHEAILTQAHSLQKAGNEVKLLPPGRHGRLTASDIVALDLPAGSIVSLMHGNNETGSLSDVAAIGAYCAKQEILFHTDAVQTAGLYDLQSIIEEVDLLSVSAHKFYGPKGVGCLVVTRNAELATLIEGGAQERRRRGGTENVAGIVGMAHALALAVEERAVRVAHLRVLKRRLISALEGLLDAGSYVLNTSPQEEESIPHIVNVAFKPVDGKAMDGEMLILNLDLEGVMVSSGSACTSGAIEPSHVLLGLGLDQDTAAAAVRFSLGKDTTSEDIDYAVDKLGTIIKRMR